MIHAFFGKPELKRMREVGSGISTIRPDSGCTLAVMAITGRNQNACGSDPACLPDTHCTWCFSVYLRLCRVMRLLCRATGIIIVNFTPNTTTEMSGRTTLLIHSLHRMSSSTVWWLVSNNSKHPLCSTCRPSIIRHSF